MKKLYTGGTFDLFHYGHVSFLKKCKMIADHVTVALNTDEFVLSYKGEKPILSYAERELSLKSSGLVDNVIANFGGHDSKPAILFSSPNILAVGDDWAHKDYFMQMQFTEEWLDQHGIVLVYLTYTKTISSSEIKARIKNA